MSLFQHYIATSPQILEEGEMSYDEQTKLNTVRNWKSGQGNQEGKSKQARPKRIINHFLLGQAPLQLNQLLLLLKFNEKTDTVGRRGKKSINNVYHYILDGYERINPTRFESNSKFINIKEIRKQRTPDNVLVWALRAKCKARSFPCGSEIRYLVVLTQNGRSETGQPVLAVGEGVQVGFKKVALWPWHLQRRKHLMS